MESATITQFHHSREQEDLEEGSRRDRWRRRYERLKILHCSSSRLFLFIEIKVTQAT